MTGFSFEAFVVALQVICRKEYHNLPMDDAFPKMLKERVLPNAEKVSFVLALDLEPLSLSLSLPPHQEYVPICHAYVMVKNTFPSFKQCGGFDYHHRR